MLTRITTRSAARAISRAAYSTSTSTPPPFPAAQPAEPNANLLSPPPASDAPFKETHFGFRTVAEDMKESLVGGVFSSVAASYDVMNDAMSLGIHRLWKDHFITSLDPRGLSTSDPEVIERDGGGGLNVIDMAGGTGDIAQRILDNARLKHADRSVRVTVMDINADMLQEGKRRARQSIYHGTNQLKFEQANAEELAHVPDNTVDLYTIAFGIRNCTHIDRVLSEAHRVLKPGGAFACLEFGKVGNPVLSTLYSQYSFNVIPTLGHLIAGDRESYQYLVESIERFPSQPAFAQMMRDAGFRVAGKQGWEDLTGGIASIWRGVKV